ncbi:hypothetical protein L1987_51950 [Smallanthus sonchifolius]|uniref:Uncharacterized protein n=1 Tax=Smallanthus sonchifolius TaxID=185202 RepID=A0ACB9ESX4_9ASTR|nr:hypothetical protein L1987_51950 [Smallanthus sonchifolius]
MDRLPSPDSATLLDAGANCWLDDACIADIDYFVKTLSGIKAKGVRPDLIGSIITHYACKWIPELSGDPASPVDTDHQPPPESATASWLKKRFFIETIVSVLPLEKDAVPCSFLLRLLKNANMVGAGSNYLEELEKRVAWRLDQATMKELMIPCFSHVRGTLLDVELMSRLVKRFVEINLEGLRSGAGLFKVAKLVDAYLAEAAVDSELALPEFMELAGAVPAQARATDDGLYRAIDTYLKSSGAGAAVPSPSPSNTEFLDSDKRTVTGATADLLDSTGTEEKKADFCPPMYKVIGAAYGSSVMRLPASANEGSEDDYDDDEFDDMDESPMKKSVVEEYGSGFG